MFVQNTFEQSWSYQPDNASTTDLPNNHNFYNNTSSHFNNNASNNSNNYNNLIYGSDSDITSLEFDFDLGNEILAFHLEQEASVQVSPEDSDLKEVLDDIESISSSLLFENYDLSLPTSPSTSSLLEQEIVSPVSNNNYESSGEEAGGNSSSSSSSAIGKVNKSGRVCKRVANKMAAGRYRLKKTKERDILFKECDEFEVKNGLLREKISDVELEIRCIKNLLVQALNAKKL